MPCPAEPLPFATLPGFNRFAANGALRGARAATNLALIGAPRGTYDDCCRPPQNPDFIAQLVTHDFGPFRATGIRPAIRLLKVVMAEVAALRPDVFARLTCAGMLCCRRSRSACPAATISNHAWGIAIDLGIDGQEDAPGARRARRGLVEIQPFFRRHGFYWGAAFPAAEPGHFEASEQLVRQWAAAGDFGAAAAAMAAALARRGLAIGDRGVEVLTVQQALNAHLPIQIEEDGIYGGDTQAAVIELQRRRRMRPDGVAGRSVHRALGLI